MVSLAQGIGVACEAQSYKEDCCLKDKDLGPPAERGKDSLFRFHAMILGFFENGDAAEIGFSEKTRSWKRSMRRRSTEKIEPVAGRIIPWPMRLMSMRETHCRMS